LQQSGIEFTLFVPNDTYTVQIQAFFKDGAWYEKPVFETSKHVAFNNSVFNKPQTITSQPNILHEILELKEKHFFYLGNSESGASAVMVAFRRASELQKKHIERETEIEDAKFNEVIEATDHANIPKLLQNDKIKLNEQDKGQVTSIHASIDGLENRINHIDNCEITNLSILYQNMKDIYTLADEISQDKSKMSCTMNNVQLRILKTKLSNRLHRIQEYKGVLILISSYKA
jgi:hypothetical protein